MKIVHRKIEEENPIAKVSIEADRMARRVLQALCEGGRERKRPVFHIVRWDGQKLIRLR